MAKGTDVTDKQATAVEEKATDKKPAEKYVTRYTVEELAENSEKAFNTTKVMVLAALDSSKEYTLDEAKSIVKKFCNKEVRI